MRLTQRTVATSSLALMLHVIVTLATSVLVIFLTVSISIGTAETLARSGSTMMRIRGLELARIDWVLPLFAGPHAVRTFLQALQLTGVSAWGYPLVLLRSVTPTFVRGLICGGVWMGLSFIDVGEIDSAGHVFMQALAIGAIWMIARQFRLIAGRVAGVNNGGLQRRSVRGANLTAIDELRERFR